MKLSLRPLSLEGWVEYTAEEGILALLADCLSPIAYRKGVHDDQMICDEP